MQRKEYAEALNRQSDNFHVRVEVKQYENLHIAIAVHLIVVLTHHPQHYLHSTSSPVSWVARKRGQWTIA